MNAAEVRNSQDMAVIKQHVKTASERDPHTREIILRGMLVSEDVAVQLRNEGFRVERYIDGVSVRW